MRIQGILVSLLVVLLTSVAAASAQETSPVITLQVDAGYDGLFRENDWFPLLVDVANDGGDVAGRLVLRPATSGNAFTNTFSTPVDMPAGSRKSVFLYVTARSFATEARVEFLDDDQLTLAAEQVPLRSVLAQDQLHVVLTGSSAGSVDLTGVGPGGYNVFQANWQIQNLPDHVAALETIDTLLFSDIDTGTITAGQQQALADWVTGGGHLIVTGGANWQATASGLMDLLPLEPDSSDTLDSLSALADFVSVGSDSLDETTVIAVGTPRPDAQVLVATEEGDVPLLLRRVQGLGTVDYLVADPLAQPLRGWNALDQLWFSLASTRASQPGWTYGISDYDRAANATEVLPGLDLLPDVLPLCGFLAIYVALIGPLNYVVLNRVNRREYAWVTIPLFIIIFSGLAWVVGFNLRGNTATLSRLAIVQLWPDQETAQVDGLIGLLSPRRSNYTLTMTDGSLLRPVSRTVQVNPFAASVQSSTDIQQADLFRADNFTVDASFIATFNTATTIDAPDLGGQASLFYEPPRLDEEIGHWSVRGSVRNDSDFTLNNPVILARGASLPLETDLAPGDLQTFDLALINASPQPASPSPLERAAGQQIARLTFNRFSRRTSDSEQTVRDIMGESLYNVTAYSRGPGPNAVDQENFRRQLLLSAAMRDQFLSTGRGNQVYLAGWADAMPLETELEGAVWEPMDTTLYIAALEVDVAPATGSARVTADQFTWVATERSSLSSEVAPVNADFQQGDVAVFRFTPMPGSVLADVETLYIEMNLTGGSSFNVPIEVWDWDAELWEQIELVRPDERTTGRSQSISDPDRFLGAQNAVQVRLAVDDETSSFLRMTRLVVEQEGRF